MGSDQEDDQGKHRADDIRDWKTHSVAESARPANYQSNVKHVGPNTAKPYERVRNSVPQVTQTPFMRHC